MTGFSANTNLGALTALRFYQASTTTLDDVRQRVGTGLRVAGPREDSSSFSVAQGVRGEIKAWQAVSTSLGAAHGVLSVALGAATQISSTLGDLKKKVIEYSSADTARQPIVQADIDAILTNIDTMASNATYNGVNLIGAESFGVSISMVQPPQPALEGVTFTLSDPGNGTVSQTISLGAYSGVVRIEYQRLSGTGDIWLEYPDNTIVDLNINNPGFPNGTLTEPYPATPTTTAEVVMMNFAGAGLINFQFYVDTDPIAVATAIPTGDYRALSDVAGGTIDAQHRSMLAANLDLSALNLGAMSSALAQIESAQSEVDANLGYFGAKLREVSHAEDAAIRFGDALSEGLGSLVDADLHRESALLSAARTREELSLEALSQANRRPQVILDLLAAVRASGAGARR